MSTPNDPKPVEPVTPSPAGAPVEPPSLDDAGTQALADALGSSFKILRFLMAVLVIVFFMSGMFTVEPNQVAVKLRFGRPVGTGAEQLLKPGWHWAWPYPVEEKVIIPVGQSHTIVATNGWYPETAEMLARNEKPEAKGFLSPGVDGYTISGDGNIIHVRTELKYRITDPLSYAFRFTGATNLLLHVMDNAMYYASAQSTADGALYNDKARFQERVKERISRAVDELKLGIQIETMDVRTSAPGDVVGKFEEVLTAQQEADTKVREAEGYASGATNRAAGDRVVIVENARTASNQVVQVASAEAKYFKDQLPYFRSNPRLFKERLLAEARTRVFTNAVEKQILPVNPAQIRLMISREPRKTVQESRP
ncbi:MAG TPA: protease modulator HflK [Verrucomicrobiae bacterium]|nr:protease modulator HflK [Verrucomicrobiae bacterium]